jgi:hypothetical protein
MILASIGALTTLGLGLMGLLRPSAAAAFTSIQPLGPVGVAEIRATYGRLFAALGAYGLWAQSPAVFAVLAVAWGGAALGRVVAIAVDGSHTPQNLGGVAFEGLIALLCWSGA